MEVKKRKFLKLSKRMHEREMLKQNRGLLLLMPGFLRKNKMR